MINVAVISSRSTVIVPNLSGLTSSQALAALSAVELTVGSTSTTTSGASSANTGQVSSQSVTAGTEVERYSSVGYVTYYYEGSPPTPAYGIWISGCTSGGGSRTFLDSSWDCAGATTYAQSQGWTNISCSSGYENSPTVSIPSCSTPSVSPAVSPGVSPGCNYTPGCYTISTNCYECYDACGNISSSEYSGCSGPTP